MLFDLPSSNDARNPLFLWLDASEVKMTNISLPVLVIDNRDSLPQSLRITGAPALGPL